ncbi:mRNA surveillance protein pelota [Methanocella sp. CWC-04]|uniref:Protein pelota homolog n=1 Tax=Methanooceanicella nereidis TaxID=2052831 RepID=A0AAP2REX4_9EURY|nr:mRNA surveillance protein pelota [Methanocella sp. CWC-04]MCD1294820.1 mRNA surveillance protein pelota [Methanocella sp. CWC-04]
MKVNKQELKGHQGEISLTPESLDDLWHLKYIIEPHDLVFAMTFRAVDAVSDKIRPDKIEKKLVRLGVDVETVEFHKFSNRLRIKGTIVSDLDTGAYHTINIEPFNELSIVKYWKNDQLERVHEAVEAAKRPEVVIATIEEGEAVIGNVRQYGVEEVSRIRQSSSGKREGTDARGDFFGEVASQLKYAEKAQTIVVAGPGFIKDDFVKFLKSNYKEVAEKVVVEDTSSIGSSGFQEVLRRGALQRLIEETRITREATYIESLMAEIAKDGKAAYGYNETKKAVDFGAVETLLIADETLRNFREKGMSDVEEMMRSVEYSRGKVVVFSTEFEPGQRLEKLGGIAALLRFPMA